MTLYVRICCWMLLQFAECFQKQQCGGEDNILQWGPPKGKNSGLYFLTPAAHTFCSKSKSIVQKNAFCQLSMSTLSLEQAGGNVYFDLFKCGRISQWSGDEIYWMANSLLSRCRPAVPSRNPQGFSPATFQSWVESTIPIVYICFNFDTVFSQL